MATYNEPLEWIKKSIESILDQTFKDFELILIDDNPERKELLGILNKYKEIDERIVLVKNDRNYGLPKSLNIGLGIARGEYIARMDADDVSVRDRFLVQSNFLNNNQDCFLVGASVVLMNKEGVEIKKVYPITGGEKIKKKLQLTNCIYHPTIMFRNEGVLYREKLKYAEDYDLYLRLISRGKKLENINQTLLYYRIGNNKSISNDKKLLQKFHNYYARKFYRQRAANGCDNYNSFNEKELERSPFKFSPFIFIIIFLKIIFWKIYKF